MASYVRARCSIVVAVLFFLVSILALHRAQAQDGAGSPGADSNLAFQTDLFTGRFTHKIPIAIPQARGKFPPMLALSYNSGASNGVCGVGWGFDPGFIQRETRKGVPVKFPAAGGAAYSAYDDLKGYTFSFQGASSHLTKVAQSPLTYYPEVDRSHLRFEDIGSSWRVYDKSGNEYAFGETAASRMSHPNFPVTNNGDEVYRWALSRVTDPNGNTAWYSYFEDAGQLYLQQVLYNGCYPTPCGTPTHTVDFVYTDRTDTSTSYMSGYRVETRKLLSEILVKVSGQLVRRYVIGYDMSAATKRSLLASVTEFGADGITSLPAVSFHYQNKPFAFGPQQAWTGLASQGQTSSDWNTIRGRSAIVNTSVSETYTHLDLRDVDGDGFPDRLMRKTNAPYDQVAVQYGTGSGFDPVLRWLPMPTPDQNSIGWSGLQFNDGNASATLVTFQDMNGDGLADRVHRSYFTPYNYLQVQINNKAGFDFPDAWGPLDNQGQGSSNSSWNSPGASGNEKVWVTLNDMNGDGLADRVMRKAGAPYDRFKVQLNTGSNFTPSMDWTGVSSQGQTNVDWNSLYYFPNDTTAVGLYDMNGDGLPDRVMRKVSAPFDQFVVQFNTGYGFAPSENWGPLDSQGNTSSDWNSLTATSTGSQYDNYVSMGDVNGDGRVDRIMRKAGTPYNYFYVQINNGHGFEPATPFGPLNSQGQSADYWNVPNASDGTYHEDTYLDFLDMNGDGLADRVMRKAGSPYDRIYVEPNQGPFPDLLSHADNGLGGSVDVTYRPSTQYDNRDKAWTGNPWDAGAVSLLPFPVQTVATQTVSDGLGNSWMTSFTYQGGMFDPVDREFRGFHKVEVTDPSLKKTKTFFHQGGGFDGTALGEFQDVSKAKTGTPYRVEMWGNDGKMYSARINKVEYQQHYNPYGPPYDPTGGYWLTPFISQTVEIEYEGQVAYRATARRFEYDFNGNLWIESKLGEVVNFYPSTHSLTDWGTDAVYTRYYYYPFANPNIYDRPMLVQVSSDYAGNQKLQETQFGYDDRGNITMRSRWLDADQSYSTTAADSFALEFFDYYANGNQKTSTDASGLTTTTVYEPTYNIFPQTITTGTFVTSVQFDVRSGKALSTTNERGLVTEKSYDNFYRPTETRISSVPFGPANIWKERFDYQHGMAAGQNYVRHRVRDGFDATNGHETFSYQDGLGRSIQTRAEAENGQFRVVNVRYNESGNPNNQSIPYFSTGNGYAVPSGSQPAVATDFDPIRRANRMTPPVGDVGSPSAPQIVEYAESSNPWTTRNFDALGKETKTLHDAFGRVRQATEFNGTATLNSYYDYDLLGNLRTIIDAAGNTTVFQFDSLGRKTLVIDPDLGTWSYVYDASGKLKEQTDAKQQKRKFFHDGMGRLIRAEAYDAGNVLRKTTLYTYDTSNDVNYTVLKGQLFKVEEIETGNPSGGGWQKHSYDVRGRLLKMTRHLNTNAKDYTIEKLYDDADHIVELRYPENSARLKYSYDAAGNLIRIESLAGTGPKEVFFQANGFDEMGQLLGAHYGSGVNASYQMYANSKRLKSVNSSGPDGPLQDLHYTYDEIGNVKSITDLFYTGAGNGSLSNIQYDDLHRLTSYQRSGVTTNFQFDSIGNTLVNGEAGTGTYQYWGGKPHAVTSANGKSYAYDANGNMTARGSQILDYDEENRLVRVLEGSTATTFGYAHDGARLWKRRGTSLSVWIGGIYEVRDGRKLCHVIADGKRICTFEPIPQGQMLLAQPRLVSGGGPIPPQFLPVFYYNLPDHLRSANVVTDRAGRLVQHYEYQTYGKERFAANTQAFAVSNRFTDQILDSETGLYYYNARYYDPELGRFVQPDTILPDLDNPQALNRYTYGANNPLKYTDPSGHFFQAILIAALIGGAFNALRAAILGEDIWEAFKTGAIQGALTAAFVELGLPDIYARILAGAGTGAAQGEDPVVAAVSSSFSTLSGSFIDEVPAGTLGKDFNLGGWLKNAGTELLNNTIAGAGAGAAAAYMQGGDAWQGALEGGKAAATSTGLRIGLIGTKVALPFDQKDLQAEFQKQSANDNSGLNLQLPKEGSYNATVGGLLTLIPKMTMHAFGTTVSFNSSQIQDITLVAHELRHVAQFQTLGASAFVKEYMTIVDDQISDSWFGGSSQLYAAPGSSDYGFRLEPKFW